MYANGCKCKLRITLLVFVEAGCAWVDGFFLDAGCLPDDGVWLPVRLEGDATPLPDFRLPPLEAALFGLAFLMTGGSTSVSAVVAVADCFFLGAAPEGASIRVPIRPMCDKPAKYIVHQLHVHAACIILHGMCDDKEAFT